MAAQLQLAPSVSLSRLADGQVRLSNGADLTLMLTPVQAGIVDAFRRPVTVEELAPPGPTREAVRRMADDLEQKLVLVRVDQSPEEEMRRVWNYLALGDVERALFHIDNESHSLDAFRASGEEAVRALERLVSLSPASRVATIGCGMGRIERALAARVGHITAFDISDEMLARARRWLEGLGNVQLCLSDGTLAPLAAQSTDLVASFLVFQHVTREGTWRYFAEAARVLVPGGCFCFQIHCHAEGARAPAVVSAVERYYGAGKAMYSEPEVREQLGRVGFQVESFRDGGMVGDERRLTGTPGTWRSVLVCARR